MKISGNNFQLATIHSAIEFYASKTPTCIAVACNGQNINYADLNKNANKIARYFREIGVTVGTKIGVNMEKSIDAVIVFLAVLKAGGVYVPLDAIYPESRRIFMMQDSGTDFLITSSNLSTEMHQEYDFLTSVLSYEEVVVKTSKYENNNFDHSEMGISSSDGAYVIYTSGTTGTPKGMVLAHQALTNLIHWQTQDRGIPGSKPRISQFANISFDVSLQELGYSLINGYSLHVVPSETRQSMDDYAKFLIKNKITSIFVTTSILELLVESFFELDLDDISLSEIFVSGETLKITSIIRRFFQKYSNVCLINQYGPSESHVMLSYTLSKSSMDWEDFPPLGKAIEHFETYVLNDKHVPVGLGEVGELFISGIGLTTGFINRSELTQDKFLPNPFSKKYPYQVMYKTGDLVKLLPDGKLQHAGRSDFQVKIRGFRIELGEIESLLEKHPSIRQCVVLVHNGSGGEATSLASKRLVAYYTAENKLTQDEIFKYLSDKLPDYMIPAFFVHTEKMPLTANRKVDREKLLKIPIESSKNYVAPTTNLERKICTVWATVLGLPVEIVGIKDNFFHLGGNSILAIKLVSELSKELDRTLTLPTFLENNTIVKLVAYLEATPIKNRPIPRYNFSKQPQKQNLSFSQERLWFIDKYEAGTNLYNIPVVYSLKSNMDLICLEKALESIIGRYEVLRTLIKENSLGDTWQVVSSDKILFKIEKETVDTYEQLNEIINKNSKIIFNLKEEFPVKVALYTVRNKGNFLFILFHHIAMDGWSIEIFFSELMQYYNIYSDSSSLSLPKLSIQYKDFACWQKEYLTKEMLDKQLSFWLDKLKGYETLNLALDRKRPEKFQHEGSAVGLTLDDVTYKGLQDLVKNIEVSLYSLLLSAFFMMLKLYSAQKDILVGMPVSNRHYPGTEDQLGFFANTLAIRLLVSSDMSIREFIKLVHNEVINIQINQDLPFDYLVEKLKVPKDISKHPLFQVMFTLQSFSDDMFGLEETSNTSESLLEPYKKYIPLYDTAKADLTAFVNHSGKKISCVFNYATSIFNKSTVDNFLLTFELILKNLVSSQFHCSKKTLRISDLDWVNHAEYKKIIMDWNDHFNLSYSEFTVNQLFEQQVKKSGGKTALVFQDKILSYDNLNTRVNRLANFMLKNFDVKAGDRIALYLMPSEHMLIAIFAVLKMGAAYIPIDPSNPKDRLSYILSDTGTSLILTDQSSKDNLSFIKNNINILSLNSPSVSQSLEAESTVNPKNKITPDSDAYIIYTSGTTGQPKGVVVQHKSLVAFCKNENYCALNEESTVLGYSNYAFDGSVFDFFTTLLKGAKLVLTTKEVILDATALHQLIKTHNADVMFLTSALFSNYADMDQKNPLYSLSTLLFGGEKIDCNKVKNFFNYNKKTKLIHVYGPTENIVFSTYCDLNNENYELMPIGKGLSEKKLYLLGDDLEVLPVGAVGELYIGGLGLAKEYLNQPTLTSQKFLNNPFQTEQEKKLKICNKIYKTGDLMRYLPNGDLQYLRRKDFQIKIRGHRVELEDIENSLVKFPDVEKALVLVKGEGEDKKLSAYLLIGSLPNREQLQTLCNNIHSFLKNEIPDYMLPNNFAFFDKFPVNINGKIDRNNLLNTTSFSPSINRNFSAPSGHYEVLFLNIWKKILNNEHISVFDSFFNVGGNSLLLAKMYVSLPTEIKDKLRLIDFFQYPTISMISKFLSKDLHINADDGLVEKAQNNRIHNSTSKFNDNIAIIGMSGRFPGADGITDFWENLNLSKESITFYTKEELLNQGVNSALLENTYYVKAQSSLRDVRNFDEKFFGYNPSEASLIDPQQRVFLECAYHALEDAGYCNTLDTKDRIGLYASVGRNRYRLDHVTEPGMEDPVGQYQVMIGNDVDFLCTRVAYKLGLKGPAVTVQTACSSSLVAIHQACLALKFGDCDVALSGGVSFQALHATGYMYQPDMIGSPDGKCRAFDADAEGTFGGQGVGIVVLKRLDQAVQDNNRIYAVIRGHAINNDGSEKMGFTAPGIQGQSEVVELALERAGVRSDEITYIEAHGTGTKLGDPIEVEALTKAFRKTSNKKGFCAIGSVKPNIGHLDAASGVTGFIKASLCLYHKKLVPTLHYNNPNPKIDFENSPFYVNTELRDWETPLLPRKAGVSSFGVGGTNAHVILEEYVPSNICKNDSEEDPFYLISFSAHTKLALERKQKELINFIQKNPSLNIADISFTLLTRRNNFPHKIHLVCKKGEDIILGLRECSFEYSSPQANSSAIIFMFPGQGAQYAGMGKKLYETQRIFCQNVDACISVLNNELNITFDKSQLFDLNINMNQTRLTQPALFILEYSLAKYLISLGLSPSALIGHSLGEYVAACISGLFSLKDALFLILSRAELMESVEEGAMLSVSMEHDKIKLAAIADVDVAVVNDEKSFVASGSIKNIKKLSNYLDKNNIQYKHLKVCRAFHSRMMDSILEKFRAVFNHINFHRPHIPFISNLSGKWAVEKEVMTSDYWVKHLRNTVLFSKGISSLFETNGLQDAVFIEVGPGRTLTNIGKRMSIHLPTKKLVPIIKNGDVKHTEDYDLLDALYNLYNMGLKIKWQNLFSPSSHRLDIPRYPFERNCYLIKKQKETEIPLDFPINSSSSSKNIHEREKLKNETLKSESFDRPSPSQDIHFLKLRTIWKELLGFEEIKSEDNFFDLGGDSLLAIRMVLKIKIIFNIDLSLQDILENTTFHALSQLISRKVEPTEISLVNEDWSSIIVKLRDSNVGEKKKIFLIHPIGGYLLCYRDLVKSLPENYSVYGIQCPYFEKYCITTDLDSIESIAWHYIKAIKSIQPNGPYSLLGTSLGGIISYEIARQLSKSGEKISLLVLIDAIRPNSSAMKSKDAIDIFKDILHLYDKKPIAREELVAMSEDEKTKLLISAMRIGGLDHQKKKQIFKQIQSYTRSISNYAAEIYEGDIIFFNAEQRFYDYQHLILADTWKDVVKGRIHSYEVPGDHFSLIMEPNVNELTQQLKDHL